MDSNNTSRNTHTPTPGSSRIPIPTGSRPSSRHQVVEQGPVASRIPVLASQRRDVSQRRDITSSASTTSGIPRINLRTVQSLTSVSQTQESSLPSVSQTGGPPSQSTSQIAESSSSRSVSHAQQDNAQTAQTAQVASRKRESSIPFVSQMRESPLLSIPQFRHRMSAPQSTSQIPKTETQLSEAQAILESRRISQPTSQRFAPSFRSVSQPRAASQYSSQQVSYSSSSRAVSQPKFPSSQPIPHYQASLNRLLAHRRATSQSNERATPDELRAQWREMYFATRSLDQTSSETQSHEQPGDISEHTVGVEASSPTTITAISSPSAILLAPSFSPIVSVFGKASASTTNEVAPAVEPASIISAVVPAFVGVPVIAPATTIPTVVPAMTPSSTMNANGEETSRVSEQREPRSKIDTPTQIQRSTSPSSSVRPSAIPRRAISMSPESPIQLRRTSRDRTQLRYQTIITATHQRLTSRASAPSLAAVAAESQSDVSPPSTGLRRRMGYYDLKTKSTEPPLEMEESVRKPRSWSEEEVAALVISILDGVADTQKDSGSDALFLMDDDSIDTPPREPKSRRQPGSSASPLSRYGSGNGLLPPVRQTNRPEGSAHASLSHIVSPERQPSPSVALETLRPQDEGDNSTPSHLSESPAQPINLGQDEETVEAPTISVPTQLHVSSSEAEGEGERGEETPISKRDPGELLRLFRAGAQDIHQEISQQRQKIREDLATTSCQQLARERVWRMEGPDGASSALSGGVYTPSTAALAEGQRRTALPGWWPPASEGSPSGSSSSPSGGSGGKSCGSSPGRVLPNGHIAFAIAVNNPSEYNLVHSGTGRSTPLLDKIIDPVLLAAPALEDREVEPQVPEPPVALAPIPNPTVKVDSDADPVAEVPPPPALIECVEDEDDEEPEIPEDILRLTVVDRFGAVWAPAPDEALPGLDVEDPAIRHALEQREERRRNRLRQYMAGTHGVVKYEASMRIANDNVSGLPTAAEDEGSLSLAAGGSADGVVAIIERAGLDPFLSFWSTVMTNHAFMNAHPLRPERFPPVKAKVMEMDHGQRNVITWGELGGEMLEKAQSFDGSEVKRARREGNRLGRKRGEGMKCYAGRRRLLNHPAAPPVFGGVVRREKEFEPSGFKKLLAFSGNIMGYVKERITYKKGKQTQLEEPKPREGQGYYEYVRVGRGMRRVWHDLPTHLDEGRNGAVNEDRQSS
ncbi:hypothetical protein TWF694_005308 [Orbilia ellipsospora]|uniref:Uncharacterized protein n=1 Tax=Orbilia ellipsospora TaxID=2528407 RepID=A0AAV9WV83_9PEZI